MRSAKVYSFFQVKGYEVENKVVYRDERYTVARAVLRKPAGSDVDDNMVFRVKGTATGISRRSDLDGANEEVGENIALARALDALYKKYTRKDHSVHKWYHG
jgi:hypothetical protein